MSELEDNQALREEFNRWAEQGRGEEMEEDHFPITLPVLDLMQMSSTWAAARDGWSAYFPSACRKDASWVWIFPTKWCAAREGTTSRWRTRCSSSAAWMKFPGTRIFSRERFRSSRHTTGRIRHAVCARFFECCAKAGRRGSSSTTIETMRIAISGPRSLRLLHTC